MFMLLRGLLLWELRSARCSVYLCLRLEATRCISGNKCDSSIGATHWNVTVMECFTALARVGNMIPPVKLWWSLLKKTFFVCLDAINKILFEISFHFVIDKRLCQNILFLANPKLPFIRPYTFLNVVVGS